MAVAASACVVCMSATCLCSLGWDDDDDCTAASKSHMILLNLLAHLLPRTEVIYWSDSNVAGVNIRIIVVLVVPVVHSCSIRKVQSI